MHRQHGWCSTAGQMFAGHVSRVYLEVKDITHGTTQLLQHLGVIPVPVGNSRAA